MLQLTNITKVYSSGAEKVEALKDVNLEFRKNEFVSILGQSGCGKTTLLNIIGGLDRYTDGDLVINGKSTKTFKDSDWDTYRNHSIGFVFQSYNLIPHQSVLANVELALTLSGVSKSERRQRAISALESVGLADQINKKPTQMSGGQMQRVAIARALVNNPDILLADEPTGALDTKTSVQIMEILKEVAKDRLVIMVTHNPDLADEYSTRIVKLSDGLVIDDSNPYDSSAEIIEKETPVSAPKKEKKKNKKAEKKRRMSFGTALSLSMNNLFTKKGRTVMTSLAGSIGIIGIALILSLSNGIQLFINQVQEDTLSTYPLSIQKETQDMSALLSAMTNSSASTDYSDSGMIYVDDSLGTMMSAMTSTVENNLEAFKAHIDANRESLNEYVSDIQYTYDYNLQVFNTANGTVKVGMDVVFEHMGEAFSGMSEMMEMGGSSINVFSEMMDNQELLDQQYEVVAGNWPAKDAADEVVLVVNSNNQISKMTLYMLGILDPDNIEEEMQDLQNGKYNPEDLPPYTYEDILNMKFKLLTTSDFFEKNPDASKGYTVNGKQYSSWIDIREYPGYDQQEFVAENGRDVKIVGIVRPKVDATATSISGAVGYTKALTNYILEKNEDSEVINQQKETPTVNVLTGLKFERTVYTRENIQELIDKVDKATMDMFYAYMTNYITSSEDTSALLNVTRANINTMFMLIDEEQQAELLTKIITSASAQNSAGCDRVFTTISGMTGGIQVTAENITTLLPILNKMETMPLVIAMGVPGLTTLAGPDAVEDVVAQINNNHPEFSAPVTAQTLMMTMGTLPAEEQTEAYEKLVGSINDANDTMVAILCGMLSAQTGVEFTKDNLAQTLPTLTGPQAMMGMMALSGMPGFVDYADTDTMTEVYDEMNDLIMNLEVNDKIFSLLLYAMPDDMFVEMEETLYKMAPGIDATYDSVLETLDDAQKASPASVNFYAKDFASKEYVEKFIDDYNNSVEEKDQLQYSDIVGTMMSSVSTIIDVISYVLIAFVAISLVVSSIMIGIITNISVLERTKEIGILRAIGASKKDVSRVFNAETFIIGTCAGILGILITLLLCIPTNAIIQGLTGFSNVKAVLPAAAAFILIAISMGLTLIAGLIPSRSAAKKDPVEALRSE